MKKNFLIYAIVAVLIFAGGGFYGGMKYQNYRMAKRVRGFASGQGLGSRGSNQNRNGGSFTAGNITAKDDKSITVKSPDGSSKIVYFSDSTTVAKSEKGTSGDLVVGQNINANGKANSDGSIAAENIQIR